MNIAIIGCGFVADFYMMTLARHPKLQVVAAMDIVPAHADRFAAYWRVPVFYEHSDLFEKCNFDIALNLTNPHAHYEVSKYYLERGRHVYSEKPLAMEFEHARELMALAEAKGVTLSCAPCNHLSEAAASVRTALAANAIGTPRLIYAEMDDGHIALSPYKSWKNVSGAPWPYQDEFEVGCTLEHIGYYLTWLLLCFGPVERVISCRALLHPGKPVGDGPEAPDFSLACLVFQSGIVARLTCSVLAERDRSLRIVGDTGVLVAKDCWLYDSPVYSRSYLRIRRRFMLSPFRRKFTTPPIGPRPKRHGSAAMDFARGPAEMASAIAEGRRSYMPADFLLHLCEIALAVHGERTQEPSYMVQTRFAPLGPLPQLLY
jgi:predicted dehydrogenase